MSDVEHHEVQTLIDTLETLIDERRAKVDELRDLRDKAINTGQPLAGAAYSGSAQAIVDFADKVRDVLAQFKRRL